MPAPLCIPWPVCGGGGEKKGTEMPMTIGKSLLDCTFQTLLNYLICKRAESQAVTSVNFLLIHTTYIHEHEHFQALSGALVKLIKIVLPSIRQSNISIG